MNGFVELFDHPLGHRLGWALVHSMWEGALGTAVFAVLRFGMRRRSANARYLAACAMLVVLLAAPVATVFLMPQTTKPAPLVQTAINRLSVSGLSSQPTRAAPVSGGIPRTTPNLSDRAEQLNGLLPWVVQVWALGVLALSGRWLYGSRWIRRVKTVDTEPLAQEWLSRLRELRRRLGIARPVVLLKSALVEVPMVVGWLRPVILLPASALSGLTPAQLEAILAHELAHVRRCDYLVNWFQSLVETLMFYHPAVWWVSRCIREEREHCCDDLVVQVCGDKIIYARALMTLEESRAFPQLAFAASGGSLLHRIRRLLGIAPEDRPPSAAEFGGIALAAMGCVLVLSAIWLLNRPSLYEAAALIRISPSLALLPAESDSNNTSGALYFPFFLQTECLVMRSPAVLKGVVESLHLTDTRNGPPKAAPTTPSAGMVSSLKARLDLRPVPSTSVIEIRAADSDPAEAARIANAVAAAYKRYRLEQSRNTVRETTDGLGARIAEQEEKVRKAEAKLEQLRIELKIPDAVASENSPTVILSAETLRHIEGLRIEGEAEYVKQKTLLDQLLTLDPTNLTQTIPTIGIQDNQFNEYMQALALVDQKLISLHQDLGPEHPEVKKALAQQADLREKIRDRTNGIMMGLRAKLSATCQSLAALSNAVSNAFQADAERAKAGKKYFEAKRDLEELERFTSILQSKLEVDRTRVQPPDLIEVVEEAVAPAQPLAANRSRALSLCGVGVLLILTGGVLARAGRGGAVA
jgi:beta-lactamase regulating signal transducer with metallopeptidase domain/uncharacterized protein involved in exopolysaccharide biosynthesis